MPMQKTYHSSSGGFDFLGLRQNRGGGVEIVYDDGVARRMVWRVRSSVHDGVIGEALRHGHAKDCRVQLSLAAEGLRLQVSDDGQGLPNALEPGVGLRSMRERATELGGSLALERRAGGGTAVLACLPLGTGGAGAARNGSDGSPNGASPGRAEAPSGAAGR